jgi:hypothetical protein
MGSSSGGHGAGTAVSVGTGTFTTAAADEKQRTARPQLFFQQRSNSVTATTGAFGPVSTGTVHSGSSTARAATSSKPRPKPQDIKDYKIKVPDSLNPIAPCGACQEWLKKIAEVNPDFKVITFTDTSCEQIFVKGVK